MSFPSFDGYANFAGSTVATAPSPATSGTSLIVHAGDGAVFPTPPFDAVVWPTGSQPVGATAEIVRVTNISTDTLTIVRGPQAGDPGGTTRSIVIGDNIAANITLKALTDLQAGCPEDNYASSTTATTNTTAGVNVPTVAFNIGANQVFQFQAMLLVTCSSTTTAGGSKFAVSGPTGTTGFYTVQAPRASAATTSVFTTTTSMGTFIGPFAQTTSQEMVAINGTVISAATTGTVQVKIAANATADTVTAEIGCSIAAFRCA